MKKKQRVVTPDGIIVHVSNGRFIEWLEAEKAAGHLDGAHSFTFTLGDGTEFRADDRRKGDRRAPAE